MMMMHKPFKTRTSICLDFGCCEMRGSGKFKKKFVKSKVSQNFGIQMFVDYSDFRTLGLCYRESLIIKSGRLNMFFVVGELTSECRDVNKPSCLAHNSKDNTMLINRTFPPFLVCNLIDQSLIRYHREREGASRGTTEGIPFQSGRKKTVLRLNLKKIIFSINIYKFHDELAHQKSFFHAVVDVSVRSKSRKIEFHVGPCQIAIEKNRRRIAPYLCKAFDSCFSDWPTSTSSFSLS